MQFQQKNPFPKNSFGQIEYKFNNTDKKVPSKVPIFWNHDLEISFRKSLGKKQTSSQTDLLDT